MITNSGQEKLNKKDVNSGIWGFILSFIMLVAVSFLSVFMLFKSSAYQQKNVAKELNDYGVMQKRSQFLQEKFNYIYGKMSIQATYAVNSEVMLSDDIQDAINEIREAMGPDSAGAFKQYAALIDNIGDIRALKNSLIDINGEQATVDRDLDMCQDKMNKADESLRNSQNSKVPRPKGYKK